MPPVRQFMRQWNDFRPLLAGQRSPRKSSKACQQSLDVLNSSDYPDHLDERPFQRALLASLASYPSERIEIPTLLGLAPPVIHIESYEASV